MCEHTHRIFSPDQHIFNQTTVYNKMFSLSFLRKLFKDRTIQEIKVARTNIIFTYLKKKDRYVLLRMIF